MRQSKRESTASNAVDFCLDSFGRCLAIVKGNLLLPMRKMMFDRRASSSINTRFEPLENPVSEAMLS
eukprot:8228288-Ditylum_brightwellii.AAC.1